MPQTEQPEQSITQNADGTTTILMRDDDQHKNGKIHSAVEQLFLIIATIIGYLAGYYSH